ncbi:hypothetical protein BJ875DRAFT_235305 [Amylocarpus encephaloides]|uniref:Secreted protein n=1 Tax=Amylocarpus encephaloides TaxID=45428 RepID=A0A9P8C7G0_9HELO|nr:hypothetical protein BJ875DRAFT_235305 [Amylocarpus encephaloides]
MHVLALLAYCTLTCLRLFTFPGGASGVFHARTSVASVRYIDMSKTIHFFQAALVDMFQSASGGACGGIYLLALPAYCTPARPRPLTFSRRGSCSDAIRPRMLVREVCTQVCFIFCAIKRSSCNSCGGK